jgi:hypothetical protein
MTAGSRPPPARWPEARRTSLDGFADSADTFLESAGACAVARRFDAAAGARLGATVRAGCAGASGTNSTPAARITAAFRNSFARRIDRSVVGYAGTINKLLRRTGNPLVVDNEKTAGA